MSFEVVSDKVNDYISNEVEVSVRKGIENVVNSDVGSKIKNIVYIVVRVRLNIEISNLKSKENNIKIDRGFGNKT